MRKIYEKNKLSYLLALLVCLSGSLTAGKKSKKELFAKQIEQLINESKDGPLINRIAEERKMLKERELKDQAKRASKGKKVKKLSESEFDARIQKNLGKRFGYLLHNALQKKYRKGVSILLESGADPNIFGPEGEVLLVDAIGSATKHPFDLAFIEELIEAGADVNKSTIMGSFSPLKVAVQSEQDKVVELLLKNPNIEIDIRDDKGRTPLYYAVSNFYGEPMKKIVAMLLKKGANPNIETDKEKDNLLHSAIVKKDPFLIKILLDHGADPNRIIERRLLLTRDSLSSYDSRNYPKASDKITPLMDLMIGARGTKNNISEKNASLYKNLIDIFVKAGARINEKASNGCTVLHEAVKNNVDDSIIAKLIEVGADVNAKTNRGNPPIWFSLSRENYEATKMLLENKADANFHDKDGNSLLMFTIMQGNVPLIKLLIDHGADPGHQNSQGGDSFDTYNNRYKQLDDSVGVLFAQNRMHEHNKARAAVSKYANEIKPLLASTLTKEDQEAVKDSAYF